jgi:alkanesulfonate monooxygenase SsuD/methylene tetrahydromethanopterin reductase-like flavin-dependent oxidoreductase (luciferase family)
MAQHSERLGFDMVTFQDHPYLSQFLDTWTLLSWVAAQTERIEVSGNVLNLPLRQPPAVLARAAASLDLLSGGRVTIGIGAGTYWDSIEAIGGRRLTPRQGVGALGEAIDVIRAIWDADNPSALHVEGEYYEVDGAERGPAPAHEIPIVLGAYRPKMLDLIGRKADGWLPSLPVMEPGGLKRGNAIIDVAARAAGRDPGEITRLLNIYPDQTPDALNPNSLGGRGQHLHRRQRRTRGARTFRRRADSGRTRAGSPPAHMTMSARRRTSPTPSERLRCLDRHPVLSGGGLVMGNTTDTTICVEALREPSAPTG